MPRVLVQTSLRGCSLHRAGSMCICVRKGTSPQRQREYLAGFQGKTSSRSQRFADRKQTCPPALCRCTGVDKPQHPRARAGSSCALPARAAPALSSFRGSASQGCVPSSHWVLQHHPCLRPLRRPLPARFPGRRQPLGTLGEGWRCNHRQQERGTEEGKEEEANNGDG